MKNHNKDAHLDPKRCMISKKKIMRKTTYTKKISPAALTTGPGLFLIGQLISSGT